MNYITFFLLQALEFIKLNKELFKIERIKPLSVSGAFHTNLMEPAAEMFNEVSKNNIICIHNDFINFFLYFNTFYYKN